MAVWGAIWAGHHRSPRTSEREESEEQMFVPLSKTDVLQSIGFALTSAQEEFTRVKEGILEGFTRELLSGVRLIPEDEQKEAQRIFKEAESKVTKLELLKRMAEFGKDDEPCVLSPEDFELLECNLPAR